MSEHDTHSSVFVEIRHSSLKALRGERGLELPLERETNGRLTKPCRERVTARLQAFLKREIWQPRLRAWCAITARGVSLRRIALPRAEGANLQRLLGLQIESEFPLSPEALAWGYLPIPDGGISASATDAGSGARQELLVVAVKKEVVEEYSEIFSQCGAAVVFTVAALARRWICPPLSRGCVLLDVGRSYTEFASFENGAPMAVRVLPWGGEDVTRAIVDKLGVTHEEAERLKKQSTSQASVNPEYSPKLKAAFEAALDSLRSAINGHLAGQKIYLSGRSAQLEGLASGLAKRLGNGTQCELLQFDSGDGRSAAILGLKAASATDDAFPLVTLQSKAANGTATLARPAYWKWGIVALGLVLALLSMPYLEALVLKRGLGRKLAAIQSDRGRLAIIDRELDFLRYLKQNQPPYLDTLFLLAKAAPPGSKFDSLSMNRRGELALRGSMKDGQQVVGFRSKLIDSGFFSSVAVEEQTPTPDRQKVTVRITAQWKSTNDRQTVSIGPTPEEIEKAKTRPKQNAPGGFPGMDGGFPGGAPAPIMLPRGVSLPGAPKRVPSPNPAGKQAPSPVVPAATQ